jgi:ribosome-associated toxin RatA of RatAB toxin-antitoxin module
MMKKVESIRLIDSSPMEIWPLLSDLSLAPEYVPGVTGCEFISEHNRGLGAIRRVFPMNMDERVINWENNKGMTLELSKDGKRKFFPFKKAHFKYSISDYEPCIIKLSLEYEPYWGWLGSMLFGRIIRKRIEKTADSMKNFYQKRINV